MNDPERTPAWVYTIPVEEAAEPHDLAREERDSQAHGVLVSAFEELEEGVDDSVVIERPCRHHDDEQENAQEQIFEKPVFDGGGFSGISFRHTLVSRRLDGIRGEFVAGL